MRFAEVPQAAPFLKIPDVLESNQKQSRVNRDSVRPFDRSSLPSSCPGLSRLRGRSRFGAAKARASTPVRVCRSTWMAGTRPAMTAAENAGAARPTFPSPHTPVIPGRCAASNPESRGCGARGPSLRREIPGSRLRAPRNDGPDNDEALNGAPAPTASSANAGWPGR